MHDMSHVMHDMSYVSKIRLWKSFPATILRVDFRGEEKGICSQRDNVKYTFMCTLL